MATTNEYGLRFSGVELLRYEGDVRFPDSGLKGVVYIGEVGARGFAMRGTGFLVQVERPDKTLLYYLVTAHHVIRRMKEPHRLAIRLNDTTGKAHVLQSSGHFRWWTHPTDRSVDAAVYPWGLTNFPFKLFPTNRFLTNDLANTKMIGVGDEVFMVGMFRKAPGLTQITPIVRTGHIAMMASERMPTPYYGDAYSIWWMDSRLRDLVVLLSSYTKLFPCRCTRLRRAMRNGSAERATSSF